jgi:hypothetical protein
LQRAALCERALIEATRDLGITQLWR